MKAYKLIKDSKHIVAFGRISESIKEIRGDFIEVKKVDEINGIIDKYEDISILASGDPCFFGILNYLKKNNVNIGSVIPGISSMQYMMSKLEMSWQDAKFISFHGRKMDMESIKGNKLCIILTDKENTPTKISKYLSKNSIKGKIYVGFNLSYPDETIVKAEVGHDIEDISDLCVVVIENEMD